MSKPRMVITIEDGIIQFISFDRQLDMEVVIIDVDHDAEDQYHYTNGFEKTEIAPEYVNDTFLYYEEDKRCDSN